jgi:hypothetical protein
MESAVPSEHSQDNLSSPPKAPLEVKASGIRFAIFGYVDGKNAIVMRSDTASVELLGAYPLEAVDMSPHTRWGFLRDLIDVSQEPIQWMMSLPFLVPPRGPDSEQLVLVWQGLATGEDMLRIKRTLDRNALSIAEAVNAGDYWRGVIALSPIIAECGRANHRNRLWRAAIVVSAVLVALAASYLRPC